MPATAPLQHPDRQAPATGATVAVFPPADGATNFALDEALARRAALTGSVGVRLYSWSRATVSLGRNEPTAARYSAEAFAAAGLDVVRRPTGGRALVHLRELTYGIAGPVVPGESPRARYGRTQRLVARALRVLGVPAEIAGGMRTRADAEVCFAAAAPGEITADGRKLAAGAQWEHDGAWLQHGSILLHDDQGLLAAGLAPGVRRPALPAPATLVDLLGFEPSLDELAAAFVSALTHDGGHAQVVSSSSLALDATPFIARYRDSSWTWRR